MQCCWVALRYQVGSVHRPLLFFPSPIPTDSPSPGSPPSILVLPHPGPSGSVCGYYMARSGAKVALLDKEHFPRDKICGDAVCTPAIHILEARSLGGRAAAPYTRANPRAHAHQKMLLAGLAGRCTRSEAAPPCWVWGCGCPHLLLTPAC